MGGRGGGFGIVGRVEVGGGRVVRGVGVLVRVQFGFEGVALGPFRGRVAPLQGVDLFTVVPDPVPVQEKGAAAEELKGNIIIIQNLRLPQKPNKILLSTLTFSKTFSIPERFNTCSKYVIL